MCFLLGTAVPKEVVAKAEASRDADSTPSLALKAYVGTYRPMIGMAIFL